MKKKDARIGGYFLPLDDHHMNFESANALKSSVLLMFYLLFGSMVLAQIGWTIKGNPSIFRMLSEGHGIPEAMVIFSPCILLVIWFFLPPTQVTLNRLGQRVHYRQGKRSYAFSWDQVSFTHQWIPTKTGGSTLFTLIALPPFPEALSRLVEKKARPAPGQTFTFQLGSFDVQGPEHGQAIFAFLDTWMRSREPAADIYHAHIQSRFGASGSDS